MSSRPSEDRTRLQAASGLGTPEGAPQCQLAKRAGISIAEEVGLAVYSLRRSRMAADDTWLPRQLKGLGLSLPDGPRQMSGDAALACARIEPHGWLVTGRANLAETSGQGWLLTDVSARHASFRLTGDAAIDVLSSGGNLHGVEPGMACRMPFAQALTALIQRFTQTDFRLLVDVSYAPFMADWLADAVANQFPVEELS